MYRGSQEALLPHILDSEHAGTAEEESQLADYYNTYTDYQNSMVVKFIMGTEELTPESYNAYVEQMNKFGVEDSIRIKQEIYNRFMNF